MRGRHALPALLAPFALALAAPAHADPAYDQCVRKALIKEDFQDCGKAWLARRDAELNRVWGMAYGGTDVTVKPLLLDEQRAWIVFKDKSCLMWRDGELSRYAETVQFYLCRVAVIDARIKQLETIASDPLIGHE